MPPPLWLRRFFSVTRDITEYHLERTHNRSAVGIKGIQWKCSSYKRKLSSRMREHKYWVTAGLVGLASYYYYTHLETVPIVGRTRCVPTPVALEKLVSQSLYDSMLSDLEARGDHFLPHDDPQFKRLARIAYRIVEVVCRQDCVAKDFDWRLEIVVDESVCNAVCMPGGKILVFSGLMKVLQSDNELAVVLGHEIAHAVARHGAEDVGHRHIVGLWGCIIGHNTIQDWILKYGFFLPSSRSKEMEADTLGLFLSTSACFDPTVSSGVYRKINEVAEARLPGWMSTHPTGDQRVSNMEKILPDHLTLFLTECGHRHSSTPSAGISNAASTVGGVWNWLRGRKKEEEAWEKQFVEDSNRRH
eukprot:TRINITY_DN8577_c0_g1_i1.p1 TRINITY_DN8577_c0_g1~~TRINITY_DN8577_c0_g1_i1.p1  ORF type:complete len:381 (+),score=70.18 TRINITY_DN8577_c0_g1_i1:67-1143(+)